MRLPFPVRRLVVTHQEERLVRIAGLEPVEALVGDDVGGVARNLDLFAHLDHVGIEILALPRQHRPEIEPARLMRLALAQVPFADQRCLVAAGAQMLGDIGSAVVDRSRQRGDIVDVIIGTGEDCRTARRADRVGDIAMVQPHAFDGNPVEIGRRVDACPVATDCLGCVVIGHDEEDIGSFGHVGSPSAVPRGRRSGRFPGQRHEAARDRYECGWFLQPPENLFPRHAPTTAVLLPTD